MNIPVLDANRKSAAISFRLVWGIWIGLSLVYAAGYWRLAVLNGRLLAGCLVCSALLIQSLLIPAYTCREKFSSGAGASIQSASAALCVVGLPAIFLLLTQSSIWPSEYERHYFNFAYTNTYGFEFCLQDT